MQSKTGSYNPTVGQKTCSATYCHGTAASVGWGGTTNCASCHEASAALSSGTTDTRNRHWQHYEVGAPTATNFNAVNSSTTTSYRYNCGVCHYNLPHSQGFANVTNGIHAEVAFNIVQSPTTTGGTYAAGTLTTADSRTFGYSYNGTCSNIYCHSNGSPLGSATFTGVTVSWGKTLATAPNDCSVCHGGMANSTQGQGPIATNQHPIHITTPSGYGFSCAECHYARPRPARPSRTRRRTWTAPRTSSGARAARTAAAEHTP